LPMLETSFFRLSLDATHCRMELKHRKIKHRGACLVPKLGYPT
jgi:hypothetical protein